MRSFLAAMIVVFAVSFSAYAQEDHMGRMDADDMPMMAAQSDNGSGMDMGGSDVIVTAPGAAQSDLGLCPVSGAKASKDYSYAYKGKTYYFCCADCPKQFKADPEKYIAKMKNFNVEAYQFSYAPDTIEVNQGDHVTVNLTSRDVTHGFYIKDYGINAIVEKGKTTRVDFVADKKGEFPILCSVYCGRGHSTMKGKLVVK